MRGRRVLDVGSGEGRFSRRLAQAGAARVLGVDLSPRLVAEARRRSRALPAAVRRRLGHRVGDGAHLADTESSTFDAVLSYLSLMNFPDPGRALAEWARVLAPGGRLVAVLPHPFTQAPGAHWKAELPPVAASAPPRLSELVAGRYFERARVRFRFTPRFPAETVNEHRPLGEWSALLERAGFVIERMWEPRPSASQVVRDAFWRPYREQPYFLIWRASRVGRRAMPRTAAL